MKNAIITSACAGMLLAGTALAGGHGAHWGYAGHEAPEFWGDLSRDYSVCKTGVNQAPIDIAGMTESELSPIIFQYNSVPLSIVNNGHTVQVNYAPGSSITVDGNTYNLLQFHFHTPSENTVEGRSYPMEAHFVHADTDGNLAVVGVLFDDGATNSFIATIWAHMPEQAGETKELPELQLNVENLLPANRSYYRFNGSLTTPPCTEGVRWMVMKNAVSVSPSQARKFNTVMGGDNNRPVQPVNARPVLK